ncbi:U-box domain-containing protein 31, partial [Morella rubra]
ILDLETAVKDGVLGGIGGGVVEPADGDKLDLKKMIEELDLYEVPSVFICPISLEPISSLLGPFTSHAIGFEAIGSCKFASGFRVENELDATYEDFINGGYFICIETKINCMDEEGKPWAMQRGQGPL